MPIVLPPAPAEPVSTVAADQPAKRPAVPRYEGQLVVGRKPAVRVTQGQAADVELVVRDEAGDVIDLTSVACVNGTARTGAGSSASSSSLSDEAEAAGGLDDCGLRVRLLEALSFHTGTTPLEVAGTVVDPGAGAVRFTLPALAVVRPGVLQCQAAGFVNGRMLFACDAFVLVERGLFGLDLATGGPPTWAEIKMALRDSCPEDSYLNDEMEWDLAEVCQAVVLPVQLYNETRPILRGGSFTTATFPFQRNWLDGILAHLYRVAAAGYRREDVEYTAAGVALRDKAKHELYEKKAQEYEALFRRFVSGEKAQRNRSKAYGISYQW